MSNEFVMVPREPTAEMLAAAKKSGVIDPRVSGYCYALMVAAAPTHQGEPVGMFYLDHGGLWSEVKNPEWTGPPLVPLYAHGKPVEQSQSKPVAWMRDDGVVFHTAFLDQFGSEYKTRLQPLYTRADPGEVERIHQAWQAKYDEVLNAGEECNRLIDTLRADVERHIARRMDLAEQITEMHRQIKQLRSAVEVVVKGGQWGPEGHSHEEALKTCAAALADGEKPKAKPGVLEIEDCTFDNRPIPSGYTLGVSSEPSAQGVEGVVLLGHFHPGDGHGAVLKWESMVSELSPCPFCGGKVRAPVRVPAGHDDAFTITCNCGCKYGPDFTEEACERGWNRRAIEPEQKKVAMLWRDALQQCAELLGMQCGDDLAGVPEKLKSALSASVDTETALNTARLVMVATYSLLINGSLTPLHAQSYSDMDSLKDRIKKALNNVKAPDGKPYLPKHWLGNAP